MQVEARVFVLAAGLFAVVASPAQLACARPLPPPVPLPSEELHMLVDCPWVAEGCVEDKDGCSEKEGHGSAPAGWTARPELGAACGESAALSLLVDVAAQLRRKAALSKVRVLAPSASCGAAVQSELERLGAPEGRAELAVRSGARFVRYEVAVWHDTTCAPAGLR